MRRMDLNSTRPVPIQKCSEKFLDPSGTYIRYDAKGMGAADEMILSLLKEKYNKEMTIEQCEKLAISILKEVM